MSTPAVAAHGDRTKIGRQSVHDRDGVVVGYELLFRARPGLEAADEQTRDLSASEAIFTAFGEFGLHRLGARRNLYVNMTRGLLTGQVSMPFGPHNVVLEVLEHIEVDEELLNGIQALKYRGYRLAIDGYVGGPEHPRLLGLVDVVKLDVRRQRVTAEAERLEAAGATRVRVLEAEGVDHFGIVMQDPEGNEFCLT